MPSNDDGFFAKLKAKITFLVHTVVPPGGILASAFNMASASIGAGILGLSGASNTGGLLLAMIYLVVITYFSIFSMYILAIAAEKTQIKTFEGMARWLFPQYKYAFSYVVAAIRCFHSFSACVAYVISIGNCFQPIIAAAHNRNPDNATTAYFATKNGNRLVATLVWLCVMLPLIIPKHIDSLRYASTFAVSFMVYFVIIIVIHSCMNGLPEHANNVYLSDAGGALPGDNIYLFRTGNNVVQSVGVFVFAYVCQINAYEVWWDMRPEVRTRKNYTLAALLSMLICGTLYILVCIFGYFDFGSDKLKNNSILLMFSPLDEPAVMVAYVGVFMKLCVAYALLCMAARNSIHYIIGWQLKYSNTPYRGPQPLVDKTAAGAGDGSGDGDAAVNKKATDLVADVDSDDRAAGITDENDESYIDNIPFWKHLIVVMVIAVTSLLCGLFIPKINTVFGFAGAISGGGMAFIFPALYYMYAGNFSVKESGWYNYLNTYALLICGVVGVVFGTGGTIYSTILD